MPAAYYREAQKLGQKEFRACTSKGVNPYLSVLDAFVPSSCCGQGIDMGVISVPAEFIVGTKSQGRASAFARNFMPLAPEKSEMADKWKKLSQINKRNLLARLINLLYEEALKMNFDRRKAERVKEQYPVGTRIELQGMCNDEPGMFPGLCGTVMRVDDQPALLMKWDNGRSLSLFPDQDSFKVIEPEQSQNSKADFLLTKEQIKLGQYHDPVQWAADYYQVIKQSYAGKGSTFEANPRSMWAAFPLIDAVCARLQYVVIENADFGKIIPANDSPNTIFYLDPPYYFTEDYYPGQIFTQVDHYRLFETIMSIKGLWLLSYNFCPETVDLYSKPGLYIEKLERPNNMAQKYDPGSMYEEILVSNFDTSKPLPLQMSLSGDAPEERNFMMESKPLESVLTRGHPQS